MNLQARAYLSGLLQAAKRNVQRMAEVVPGTDAQALHHFLAHSPWDARAVMDQVAREVGGLLGGDPETCLLLDETCFAKKGTRSVGVARRWFGLQGKTDNCQVAVFAALARGKQVSLIDADLYLPREWVDDPRRCAAAGVPAERRELKTKPALALDLVRRARLNGVPFAWVAADGTYGQDRALLRALDDAGETLVIDVHRDQRVFLDNPRRAKQRRTTPEISRCAEDVRVDEWVARQPATAWQEVWIRRGSQGELRVQAVRCRVWVREAKETQARCWQLIATREIGAPDTTKYSFTNAVEKTSSQRLAYMQRQRYWVERAFQEAKNEAGMDEYQARSWQRDRRAQDVGPKGLRRCRRRGRKGLLFAQPGVAGRCVVAALECAATAARLHPHAENEVALRPDVEVDALVRAVAATLKQQTRRS